MHIAEIIWNRFRHSTRGRFIAGLLIGGAFGVSASLSISHNPRTLAVSIGVGALAGGIAALWLQARDKRRTNNPQWQQRIEQTAAEVQEVCPEVPPPLTRQVATEHEEQKFTPLVWVGVSVGLLIAACGVLAIIRKIISIFQ